MRTGESLTLTSLLLTVFSCTWEPAESFLTPQTLVDWTRKRNAGLHLAPEGVSRIEARMAQPAATEQAPVPKQLLGPAKNSSRRASVSTQASRLRKGPRLLGNPNQANAPMHPYQVSAHLLPPLLSSAAERPEP